MDIQVFALVFFWCAIILAGLLALCRAALWNCVVARRRAALQSTSGSTGGRRRSGPRSAAEERPQAADVETVVAEHTDGDKEKSSEELGCGCPADAEADVESPSSEAVAYDVSLKVVATERAHMQEVSGETELARDVGDDAV
mmetsp:Transcript_12268/g.35257  ORF Transcript_12268/g.35257 Transcript_12268/m.35257 type:complete len:142 (+) Transcript_12268:44-469(+)